MSKLRVPIMSEAELLDDLEFQSQMEDLRWKRIDEEHALRDKNPGREIVTCCKTCGKDTIRKNQADFCPSCDTYKDVTETALRVK